MKLINIRKIASLDQEDYLALVANEKVRTYLGGPVSRKAALDKFKKLLEDQEGNHLIIEDESGFCGLVQITTHVDGLGKELSYQFLPRV